MRSLVPMGDRFLINYEKLKTCVNYIANIGTAIMVRLITMASIEQNTSTDTLRPVRSDTHSYRSYSKTRYRSSYCKLFTESAPRKLDYNFLSYSYNLQDIIMPKDNSAIYCTQYKLNFTSQYMFNF